MSRIIVLIAGVLTGVLGAGGAVTTAPSHETGQPSSAITERRVVAGAEVMRMLAGTSESSSTQPAQPMAPEAVYRMAAPAVVQVLAQGEDKKVVAEGTGFVIDTGNILSRTELRRILRWPAEYGPTAHGPEESLALVVTNYHVVERATDVQLVLGDSGKDIALFVVAQDKNADLVVLSTRAKAGQPLRLNLATVPAIGTTVLAIGNPLGLTKSLSSGIVSGHRRQGQQTLIQMTASISPGSSGGPLLNERGEILGVTTASIKNGQNLNLAVPASEIVRILKASEGQTPLWRGKSMQMQEDAYVFGTMSPLLDVLPSELHDQIHEPAAEKELLAKTPKDRHYLLYCVLGWSTSMQGQYSQAIDYLTRSLALRPGFGPALYCRGKTYWHQKDYPNAIADLEAAEQVDPDIACIRFRLGKAFFDSKRLEEYVAKMREVVSIVPEDPRAHQALGHAHVLSAIPKGETAAANDELVDAIVSFREAIRLKPDCAEAHCQLGGAYHFLKPRVSAAQSLQRAIDLGLPRDADETARRMLDSLR